MNPKRNGSVLKKKKMCVTKKASNEFHLTGNVEEWPPPEDVLRFG